MPVPNPMKPRGSRDGGVTSEDRFDTDSVRSDADAEAPPPLRRVTQVPAFCMDTEDVKVDRLIKHFKREVNKLYIFRELIPYCSFLLFMLVIVMVSRSEQYESRVHRSVDAVTSALHNNEHPNLSYKKTFDQIASEDDWWRWVRSPLITNIWVGSQNTTMTAGNNKPLGFLVFRSQRVDACPCGRNEGYNAVSPTVRKHLPATCYPEYHCSISRCELSTEQYGPAAGRVVPYGAGETLADIKMEEAFVPIGSFDKSKMAFPTLSGLYQDYGHSSKSYVALIPLEGTTGDEAWQRMSELRANGWVDESTRLLSAELIFFDRNTNVFMYVASFLEIHAGGLWHPNTRVVPFRFTPIDSSEGVGIFILDVIVTIYFAYILYRLVQTLVRNWQLHGEILSFFSFWNTYATADMLLFVVTYGYRWLYWHISLTLRDEQYVLDAGAPPEAGRQATEEMWCDLASHARLYESQWNCYGFACALAIGGLFRFTQYNPRLFLLVETVERALGELISVVTMMSIVLFAYGLLGNLCFGYQMLEYKSFISSCGTLLRHLIGDFPDDAFYRMRDAQNNVYIAVVFLLSYTFIAWCILLNMILAIINESLATVKSKTGQQDIMIMAWLQEHSNRLYRKCENYSKKHRDRTHSVAMQEMAQQSKEQKLRETELLKSIYEKLKPYKADPRFQEKMMKKKLRKKFDWSQEEWEFLDDFMDLHRGEVYDQSDYAEREKLENIHYQVNQINDMLGELSMQHLDVSPKVEEIPTA
eukprot:Rhum_TRINITY_DN13219_c1_g1::Rhum_TRINITY_DN13219_c1_g1_i1::g.58232::m.58232/K04986/PKD2; polycystin 2